MTVANLHTLTFSFHPKYFWSSLIALLLHSASGARVDSDAASSDRQPRHNGYRGNTRFQVPAYLSPDGYSQTSYSTDRRSSDGNFGYEYETTNGIKVKQESTGYGANKVVRGYYSYIGSDGIPYTVNYIADRFGYRAYGAHLPTQPDAANEAPRAPTPVYNRPVNNNQLFVSSTPSPAYSPVYVTSTPAPLAVHPLQSQHHTQTSYYPQESIHSHPIYVADPSPSNFITITPKPFNNRHSISPPAYNIVTPSSLYQAPPPFAWTTSRPADYANGGFIVTTPRPYLPY